MVILLTIARNVLIELKLFATTAPSESNIDNNSNSTHRTVIIVGPVVKETYALRQQLMVSGLFAFILSKYRLIYF